MRKSVQEYISDLMKMIDFDYQAIEYFLDCHKKVKDSKLLDLSQEFVLTDLTYDEAAKYITACSNQYHIHVYSVTMLFYLYCAQTLEKQYLKNHISYNVFLNSMRDLKCKLNECKSLYDIWGTFVGSWYVGFFKMQRFAIGRLQYEHKEFKQDFYQKDGVTVKKGDLVYNIHIPSMGPLTSVLRYRSYNAAYLFYNNELKNNKPMVIVCSSWLLYPDNRLFYPKGSNILSFMDDFDYIWKIEKECFDDAWRVFGKDFNKPASLLPQKTSLQRAYVSWLMDGNIPGLGYGIKILKKSKEL